MFKELKKYEKYNDRILGEKIEWASKAYTPQGIYQDYLRTSDPNIKNKETVQQLVALSNMDENKLAQIVKDEGKIPMPSIAVMTPDIHHVDFWPIQFVFWKDTVDPKANKKNVIYGTDAYTPIFWNIDLEDVLTVTLNDQFVDDANNVIWKYLEDRTTLDEDSIEDLASYMIDRIEKEQAISPKTLGNAVSEWSQTNNKPVDVKGGFFELTSALGKYGKKDNAIKTVPWASSSNFKDKKARPLTPENIFKAMKEWQPAVRREVKPGSYKDMIQIIGSKIDDLEDVRKKNFWDFKFHEIEDQIQKLNETYDEQVSDLEEVWNYRGKNIRNDIKKAYDPDAKKFAENLNQNENAYGTVSEETAQGIIDTIEKGRQASIRFSESKPQRIVDAYKEVQYILVPEQMKKTVQQVVKWTPLENKIQTYNSRGDEDRWDSARTNALHDIQKKYGNVFFSMGGIVMPIAYLLQMMNGWEEQEWQEA